MKGDIQKLTKEISKVNITVIPILNAVESNTDKSTSSYGSVTAEQLNQRPHKKPRTPRQTDFNQKRIQKKF